MSPVSSPLFLGLDLSTQQIKAVLISQDAVITHESSVRFSEDLPHYSTTNGAYYGPDKGEVTSPVAMWLEAMDLLMQRMKDTGVDFSRIAAVSGSGQQHGSVYWSHESDAMLDGLDPAEPLLQLCPHAFSKQRCPIWQDSSTTRECRELEHAVGGPQALADLTGSRGYERFTGTQIKRIRRIAPDIYNASAHISLVSSFMPSLFLGKIAPIEIADASGMNLMNIMTSKWNDVLLDAAGGSELRAKVGPEPVLGGTHLGTVHCYWVKRWGFSPECIVAPFTGDNPATVVALSAPGDALLSLGTSTTYLLSIPPASTPPKCFTTSHLLAHPTTPGAHIAMLCYKNGALAREQVRDRFCHASWTAFNQYLESAPPGNNGYSGLYFPIEEIIPPNVLGEFLFKADPKDLNALPERTDAIPHTAHPRAIVESQFLSILSRVAAILPSGAAPLQRLVITGGASANETIRRACADMFGLPTYMCATKEAAAMGGALLAKFAWWRAQNGGGTYEEMSGGELPGMTCVAEPKVPRETYEALLPRYRLCEEEVVRVGTLEGGGLPTN
ncbi:D-xylulose kinase [Fistulina hepatica ATCC 64428]|uniref:Xylulose kinase n=1 Tax=Fistulina hepatica ATCC 64428 TaxID=1128425 RepID=A0A0D7ANP8_9AGAR|nr:D-xylulose kinase [Fistulina hepatica ATCC 64428]